MLMTKFDFSAGLCKVFASPMMNYFSRVLLAALLFAAVPLPRLAQAAASPDSGQIALAVARWLEQAHYSRHKLDSEMSAKLLTTYLEALDYNKLYFTQQDVDEFTKKYATNLDEAIFRAYKHLYLLDKQNKLGHIDLGNITSSSAGCLADAYLQRLGQKGLDQIVESVPARKLTGFWPASLNEWSTKGVRDAFYSSPLLPRLLNPDMIKRSIADGVTQGLIGYATKDSSGRLKLERLKESLFDADVEISDDVFILKPDEAQKLREPPRIAQLIVRPEHVVLNIGDQASFSCSAIDQYGQAIGIGQVDWSALGCSIESSGLLTAGDHCGAFTVKATLDGHETHAEVRITTTDEALPPPPPPGEASIRWRGLVPPQKWMNFYTKVLSKYATLPDLKLEVSFEAKVDREQADSKASETKSALRELGLNEDVTSR